MTLRLVETCATHTQQLLERVIVRIISVTGRQPVSSC